MTLIPTGIAWVNIPDPQSIKLRTVEGTISSGVFTSTATFNKNMHICVECGMSGTHAHFGLDLHQFDSSISYSTARVNWGGTMVDVNCYIDQNKYVKLDLASLTGLTDITVKFYEYN